MLFGSARGEPFSGTRTVEDSEGVNQIPATWRLVSTGLERVGKKKYLSHDTSILPASIPESQCASLAISTWLSQSLDRKTSSGNAYTPAECISKLLSIRRIRSPVISLSVEIEGSEKERD